MTLLPNSSATAAAPTTDLSEFDAKLRDLLNATEKVLRNFPDASLKAIASGTIFLRNIPKVIATIEAVDTAVKVANFMQNCVDRLSGKPSKYEGIHAADQILEKITDEQLKTGFFIVGNSDLGKPFIEGLAGRLNNKFIAVKVIHGPTKCVILAQDAIAAIHTRFGNDVHASFTIDKVQPFPHNAQSEPDHVAVRLVHMGPYQNVQITTVDNVTAQ